MFNRIFGNKETSRSLVHSMKSANEFKCQVIDEITKESEYFRFQDKLIASITMPGMEQTNVDGKMCEHMVPQGITSHDDFIFATAYCGKKEHNSVIYVMDRKTGEYVSTLVREKMSHSGGITYLNNYIYVCEGPKKQVTYYKYDDIKKLIENKERDLSKIENGVLDVENRASYCTSYGEYLCVGTHDENASKGNKIILYKHDIDAQRLIKLTSIENLPLKTQGALFYEKDDKEYLLVTASRGRFNTPSNYSRVYVYETMGIAESINQIKHIKTFIMPPMLEEATIVDDRLYIVFESASSMYRKWGASPVIGNICGFDTKLIWSYGK